MQNFCAAAAPYRPIALSGWKPAAAHTAPSVKTPRSTWKPSPTLSTRFEDLQLVFVESGGDNLAATFSPELADVTLYVIDVSAGDKIPRKGGPGITRSDLLIINKIDLAPYVGADLGVMQRDAAKMRGNRPFMFTNLRDETGLPEVLGWLCQRIDTYLDAGNAHS